MVIMAHTTPKMKKLITISYFQEAKTTAKRTVLHSDFFSSDYQDLGKDTSLEKEMSLEKR